MTPPSSAATRLPTILLALGGAALVVLFAPTVYQLSQVYLLDANYQHGFLVLPLAVLLAWNVVQQHPLPESGTIGKSSELLGVFLLLLGMFVQLVGVLSRFLPIEWLAMTLILSGTVILLGGVTWGRHFAFPIFFLIFLFPLPAALTSAIAVWLQNIVAAVSGEVLGWFFLCFRRGNNIHIAGVDEPMFVAQECSGIRQVMAFVALAALVAYWWKLGFGRGLLLIALAVPVAILSNVMRVILMGAGLVYFGPSWFNTWLHHAPAMFTLPFGAICFFGLVWIVKPDTRTPPAPSTPSTPVDTAIAEPKSLEGQPS